MKMYGYGVGKGGRNFLRTFVNDDRKTGVLV